MAHPSKYLRRVLVAATVLLAATAVLGFAQAASDTSPGHPSEPGVLVIAVQAGSPAEKAGIARGDIILDIGGAAVNTPRDIRQAITSRKPGETVSVTLRHGDAEKTLSVALGGMNGRPYMGVLLLPEMHPRLGMRPGARPGPWAMSRGAFVAGVASGSPADRAGIRRGDIILSVDGVEVGPGHTLGALIQDKQIGDTVTLSVRSRREPAPRELKITLGSAPNGKKPWLGVEYRMGLPTANLDPNEEFPPRTDL